MKFKIGDIIKSNPGDPFKLAKITDILSLDDEKDEFHDFYIAKDLQSINNDLCLTCPVALCDRYYELA